ncbi:unnamed protein product [Brachionus calyciflorus]|uniref:Cadherin domain-containing protein n=1 Tax=Brachionus calyciflorus TaxID=104777 RepID=A0A813MKD1_9BILA|nr:unnamed protein product [Brachionus calyciflorus]
MLFKQNLLISFLLIIIILACKYRRINSSPSTAYIYLNDKYIYEELDPFSLVCDLSKENTFESNIKSYTLLDDSKQSYFSLNSSRLLTNKKLDREYLCSNSLCADPCNLGILRNETCRLNIKILLTPSYSILNLNVHVLDINDNPPIFRKPLQIVQVKENVPVGYKIPLELAFDPDIHVNTIQKYEILNQTSLFTLEQNLNESKLNLIVSSLGIDREKQENYQILIRANDGRNQTDLKVIIEILDENDNSPTFDKNYYKFSIKENSPLDSLIGRVTASDKDLDLNGKIIYKFVDSSLKLLNVKPTLKKSNNKYFYLNESSGEIRLKNPIDYEEENFFSLIIEAKDQGQFEQLTDYAYVDIEILDENDNGPEISVNFLNSYFKNQSVMWKKDSDFKYDIYVPENIKANKFLAHVSIFDKDSQENSKFNWKIFLNEKELNENSALRTTRLNNNSFTINIGHSELFDYELNEYFNVTILAWDLDNYLQNVYKFRLILIDLNDNPPKFSKHFYNITKLVYPGESIIELIATDRDKNSQINYEIVETQARNYVTIENGVLKMLKNFTELNLNVVASDDGQPSISTKVKVNIKIKQEDIKFKTMFKNVFNHESLVLKVYKNFDFRIKLVEFESNVEILNDVKGVEIIDKEVFLIRKIDRKFLNFDLKVLGVKLKVRIEFIDEIDFCLNAYQLINIKPKLKFEKFNSLINNYELYISYSSLNGLYLKESELDAKNFNFTLNSLSYNLSLLTLKDENNNLVSVYRLKIPLEQIKGSNLFLKITSETHPECYLEENLVILNEEGVIRMTRNLPKHTKLFMYKLSTSDNVINKIEKLSSWNYMGLILALMCVLIIFFVTLVLMILKYFNYYKYKKNFKKTTNILQKEFNLKLDEDKNQRKIKQSYSYVPYKVQDETDCVRYVPSNNQTNFTNKTFNPNAQYSTISSNSFKKQINSNSFPVNDVGFTTINNRNECFRSPKNSIKVKILI